MLKKIFIFSMIFTTSIFTRNTKELIVDLEAEKLPIAPVVLKFNDPELDNLKFNENSEKSALQQFLERNFKNVDIKTPYRPIGLLRLSYEGSHPHIEAFYPHRMEIPSQYAHSLHDALNKSDLLIAAVYREIMAHSKDGRYSRVCIN